MKAVNSTFVEYRAISVLCLQVAVDFWICTELSSSGVFKKFSFGKLMLSKNVCNLVYTDLCCLFKVT